MLFPFEDGKIILTSAITWQVVCKEDLVRPSDLEICHGRRVPGNVPDLFPGKEIGRYHMTAHALERARGHALDILDALLDNIQNGPDSPEYTELYSFVTYLYHALGDFGCFFPPICFRGNPTYTRAVASAFSQLLGDFVFIFDARTLIDVDVQTLLHRLFTSNTLLLVVDDDDGKTLDRVEQLVLTILPVEFASPGLPGPCYHVYLKENESALAALVEMEDQTRTGLLQLIFAGDFDNAVHWENMFHVPTLCMLPRRFLNREYVANRAHPCLRQPYVYVQHETICFDDASASRATFCIYLGETDLKAIYSSLDTHISLDLHRRIIYDTRYYPRLPSVCCPELNRIWEIVESVLDYPGHPKQVAYDRSRHQQVDDDDPCAEWIAVNARRALVSTKLIYYKDDQGGMLPEAFHISNIHLTSVIPPTTMPAATAAAQQSNLPENDSILVQEP
jgi:hypothetical protein